MVQFPHAKNRFISIVLCAACFACGSAAVAAGAAREFVHPGIAESAEDIARARRMIAERREPWYGCFKALEKCWSADQVPFPSGPPIVPDWPEKRDEFQITRQLKGRRDDIPNYGYAEQLRYYIYQNGQCQESSRDQAHAVVGLGHADEEKTVE